jgi:antitoxin component YwqK of YwqJK toxin-antitoxin module
MKLNHFFLVHFFLLIVSFSAQAQDDDVKDGKLKTDSVPTLKLTVEERKEEERKKQKKFKRNVFYGKKTRKMYTQVGEGNRQALEIFYVLKKYEEPDPYIKDVYWYDLSKGRIMNTKITEKDLPNAMILHGPYKKMIGEDVVEEGVFYVGTKHARWEKYDKDFILIEKLKYHKGWAKEADISFYDSDRKKVKEVIPKINKVVEGEYFAYYESGNLKFQGKYKNGVKVGVWIEYFDAPYKKKKEIQYAKSYLDKDFKSYTIREWDNKNKLIYDKVVEDKKKILSDTTQ